MNWLALQINNHPRATPGLVVARLCLWFSTFVWGFHAVVQKNAFIHPIYRALNIQRIEDEVGTVALVLGFVQMWRILTHEETHWIGFVANLMSFCWYGYFLWAMLFLVPLAGPIFSAFTTLMCVISVVSMANDFWMKEIFFTWLSCKPFSRLFKPT